MYTQEYTGSSELREECRDQCSYVGLRARGEFMHFLVSNTNVLPPPLISRLYLVPAPAKTYAAQL